MSMYEKYIKLFRQEVPLGESFDLLEREIVIGGCRASLFFVDGLVDAENMQRVMSYLLKVQPRDIEGTNTSSRFIAEHLAFLDVTLAKPKSDGSAEAVAQEPTQWTEPQVYSAYKQAETRLYSGLVPLVVEGLNQIIIIDARSYPGRSVEEPEKEKTLRGAKDGFTEGFMQNIALIRRRLKDNNLIFNNFSIGNIGKSDVAMVYLKGKADDGLVERIKGELKALENDSQVSALTVGDQSLLEHIMKAFKIKGRLNPFPKVRYSQRPDVIAAHVAEGKIAVIVDNSPTVMLIPVGVLDFFQDVDDYYFPQITGNYFRLLRIINFLVILFLTPVYLIIANYDQFTPEVLKFFIPEESFAIPIFWQFLLLEFAIDGLKLASLNTPESLGMSLSVIGALILGEFSVSSGWFIPQTILCMAVVALASFTQPSIELSYAVKFARILMLIGAATLGVGGIIGAAAVSFAVMAATRTLSGDSYLYPLVPFQWSALKRLIFRTKV